MADIKDVTLKEMTGEFPALSQVFVTERDKTFRMLAKPVSSPITGMVIESYNVMVIKYNTVDRNVYEGALGYSFRAYLICPYRHGRCVS